MLSSSRTQRAALLMLGPVCAQLACFFCRAHRVDSTECRAGNLADKQGTQAGSDSAAVKICRPLARVTGPALPGASHSLHACKLPAAVLHDRPSTQLVTPLLSPAHNEQFRHSEAQPAHINSQPSR